MLVDASIAPLIVELNRRGFSTTYCCSGVAAEHFTNSDPGPGYIAFQRMSSVKRLWPLLPLLLLFELAIPGNERDRCVRVDEKLLPQPVDP